MNFDRADRGLRLEVTKAVTGAVDSGVFIAAIGLSLALFSLATGETATFGKMPNDARVKEEQSGHVFVRKKARCKTSQFPPDRRLVRV